VCLAERHEIADRYPEYVRWLEQAGARAIWWPIPDLHAPPIDVMLAFVDDLARRLRAGSDVLVHCGAGMGRAGTTAVCVLLRLGVPLDDSLDAVAAHRPGAGPEVGAQRDLVAAVAAQGPGPRGGEEGDA
jgi:protein-tyrosine phosphatase